MCACLLACASAYLSIDVYTLSHPVRACVYMRRWIVQVNESPSFIRRSPEWGSEQGVFGTYTHSL